MDVAVRGLASVQLRSAPSAVDSFITSPLLVQQRLQTGCLPLAEVECVFWGCGKKKEKNSLDRLF